MLQRIWTIGLMGNWFCIWDDLSNQTGARLQRVPI